MPSIEFFAITISLSLSGIELLIKSGIESLIFIERLLILDEKSSCWSLFVNNFIWSLKFEKKLLINRIAIDIEAKIIVNALSALELVYLSRLSTDWRNIVVNKNEKISMPIIEAKNGKISEARIPIIINNRSL